MQEAERPLPPNRLPQPRNAISGIVHPQVLTVAATGSSLSYTWFKNTVNSNSGGTPVGSGSTFTAPGIPGTIYYYVTVQGSCGSATSNAVPAIGCYWPNADQCAMPPWPHKYLCKWRRTPVVGNSAIRERHCGPRLSMV